MALDAAMHAADPAGREHADAGHRRDPHGGGDGGGAVVLARDQHGQVAHRCLGHARRLRHVLQLGLVQADLQPAAQHGDGGRQSAFVADDMLQGARGDHVAGIGHAVRDDGRFERHHRAALRQRIGDLRRDVEVGMCHAAWSFRRFLSIACNRRGRQGRAHGLRHADGQRGGGLAPARGLRQRLLIEQAADRAGQRGIATARHIAQHGGEGTHQRAGAVGARGVGAAIAEADQHMLARSSGAGRPPRVSGRHRTARARRRGPRLRRG